MRTIEQLPELELLNVTEEQRNRLGSWLQDEVQTALAARSAQDTLWNEMLRLYEGVPKNPVKNTPIENAPNIEVTLAAIAIDSIYAQMLDTLYNISPRLTVRATQVNDKEGVEDAKAMQRFANFVVENEAELRLASEDVLLDDIQLGTGIYYIPWIEDLKKTKSATVKHRRPKVFAIPVEDFITPGAAKGDLHSHVWIGIRFWLTESELIARSRGLNIDLGLDGSGHVTAATPIANVGWVKSKRELLGRTSSARKVGMLFEIIDLYALYDINEDKQDEDLLITWDRTSSNVLKVRYNPFDRRPCESMVYQRRAHLFNGIGVAEMLKPYQEEVTEVHNARVTNMLIANARFWKSKTGAVPDGELRIWPNKLVELDNPDDLQPEQMGEIYPSSAQAEGIAVSLSERRVGVNDLSLPSPSQIMGSRTPATTAVSLLQKVNQRFTPAFDGARLATAAAARQCLYRYAERLLLGDLGVEEHINRVMGSKAAQRIIRILKDPDFDNIVTVELTASSASVNRDADRQNAMVLVNILTGYYQKTLELVAIAANPQTPPEVRDVARKISEKSGEVIDRTIRTFDQVRDPAMFILEVKEEMDNLEGLNSPGMQGLGQIISLIGQAGGNGAQPGGGA